MNTLFGSPSRSHPIMFGLQTVKAPIRKDFGQIVLSNIEWGKGSVTVGQRIVTVIVIFVQNREVSPSRELTVFPQNGLLRGSSKA